MRFRRDGVEDQRAHSHCDRLPVNTVICRPSSRHGRRNRCWVCPCIASPGRFSNDEAPAGGCESRRGGPDHRAWKAAAVARSPKRKAQERAAYASPDGRETRTTEKINNVFLEQPEA